MATEVHRLLDVYPVCVVEYLVAQNRDKISDADWMGMFERIEECDCDLPSYFDKRDLKKLITQYAPVGSEAFAGAIHVSSKILPQDLSGAPSWPLSIFESPSPTGTLFEHLGHLGDIYVKTAAESRDASSQARKIDPDTDSFWEKNTLALKMADLDDICLDLATMWFFPKTFNDPFSRGYLQAVINRLGFNNERVRQVLQDCLRGKYSANSAICSVMACCLDPEDEVQAKWRDELIKAHASLPRNRWEVGLLRGLSDREARLFLENAAAGSNKNRVRSDLVKALPDGSALLSSLYTVKDLACRSSRMAQGVASWALRVFTFDELLKVFADNKVSLVVRDEIIYQASFGRFCLERSQIGQLAGTGKGGYSANARSTCLHFAPVDSKAYRDMAASVSEIGELAIMAARTSLDEAVAAVAGEDTKARSKAREEVLQAWAGNYLAYIEGASGESLTQIFELVEQAWLDSFFPRETPLCPSYISHFLPLVSADNERLRALLAARISQQRQAWAGSPDEREALRQMFVGRHIDGARVAYDLTLVDEHFAKAAKEALAG